MRASPWGLVHWTLSPGPEALAAQVGGLRLPDVLTSARLSGKVWGGWLWPHLQCGGGCRLHLRLGILGSGSREALQGDTCGDKAFPGNPPNGRLWGPLREEHGGSKAVPFSYFGATESHSPWLCSQALKSLQTLCLDPQVLMAKGTGRVRPGLSKEPPHSRRAGEGHLWSGVANVSPVSSL